MVSDMAGLLQWMNIGSRRADFGMFRNVPGTVCGRPSWTGGGYGRES